MTKIFLTVTAGRTGTGYLQRLFSIIPDFTSVHEPSIPSALGKVNFWNVRLKEIEKYNKSNYIETSHLICKGYIEPLLDKNIVPNLIILTRDARQIALSLLSLKTIPCRTKTGKKYLIDPTSEDSFTKLKQHPEVLNDYELCYWYCLEIEYRQKYYSKIIRSMGGKVFETSLNLLKELTHFTEMLNYFSINYDKAMIKRYLKIKDKVINSKAKHKKINKYSTEQLNKFEKTVVSSMIIPPIK